MLNLYIQYMSVTVCKITVLLGQHWHRVVWLNCNTLLLCQSALGHRQSMCWWRRRWMSDISIQSIIYLQERSAALASAPNLASLIGSSQVSPSLLLAAREDQSFIDPVKAGTSTSVYKVQSWTCLWSLMKMPLTPAKYRKHFLFVVFFLVSLDVDRQCTRQRRTTWGNWASYASMDREKLERQPRGTRRRTIS